MKKLLPLLCLFLIYASGGTVQFVDRSSAAKLNVVTYTGGVEKNHILETTGNGVLVVDYDNDFDQDLYFVNGFSFPKRGETKAHSNVLYRNNSDGTFLDVTSASGTGATLYGQGGCVGDIDNDGHPDMYITNFGPNILYRNNGNGTFTDIAAKAKVADPKWSIGCTFFDADADGDQDLYVANYLDATWQEVHAARRTRLWRGKVEVLDGPKGLPGSSDTFYVNNGDGTFTEATAKAGLSAGSDFYGMGVVSFDYDNDGDMDLYVANDSTPNCLYRNRGNGTFEEVGTVAGAGYNADGQEQGSMGVDFGDYNNDGWFDLAVTNFAHDYYTLYRSLSGKFFQDDSYAAGIAVPTFVPLGWGTLFFDADHDADLDLFFANGHIYPQVEKDPSLHETFRQKSQLFLNENAKFREISSSAGSGFQMMKSARGAALGDFDNDGDLDIVVSNQDDKPSLLMNESRTANHWLSLKLIDTKGSPLAIGSRVTITTGKLSQMRQIASGGSYASQNDLRVHFGVADSKNIDKIVIRWPDGTTETHTALTPDSLYVLQRGKKPQPR